MGIYALKPAFRRSLRPVARALHGVHPDTVSYAAMVFALLAGVCLALAPRADWLYLAVIPLFFLRLAANALDGMLAQDQAVASPRGEIVNELSDRVSDTLILGGLMWGGAVDARLAGAALAATLLVSYVGILAKAVGGMRNYAGPLGKADRMFVLGLGCAVAFTAPRLPAATFGAADALDITAIAFIALGLLTLVNRTRAAWKEAGSPA